MHIIIVLYDTAVRSTEDVHIPDPHTYFEVHTSTCMLVGFTATGSLVLTWPADNTLVMICKDNQYSIVCLADGSEPPDTHTPP